MNNEDASTPSPWPQPRPGQRHRPSAGQRPRVHPSMQWSLVIAALAGAVVLHVTTGQPGDGLPVLVSPVGRHCFATDAGHNPDR